MFFFIISNDVCKFWRVVVRFSCFTFAAQTILNQIRISTLKEKRFSKLLWRQFYFYYYFICFDFSISLKVLPNSLTFYFLHRTHTIHFDRTENYYKSEIYVTLLFIYVYMLHCCFIEKCCLRVANAIFASMYSSAEVLIKSISYSAWYVLQADTSVSYYYYYLVCCCRAFIVRK